MKYSYTALAFGAGASAAAIAPRTTGCCFQIDVNGATSGTLGQLSDGQNRVGPGYTPATYCINNGGITDSTGRGCVVTGSTTQFQCDSGASPTTGFTITSSGEIEYNGSSTFYECEAAAGVFNIYTTPGGTNCSEITLTTEGGQCAASSSSSAASATPTAASVSTITAAGPTVTATATDTVVGPTEVSTVVGPTEFSTVVGPTQFSTVAGPTVSETCSTQTSTVTETETQTVTASPVTKTEVQTITAAPVTKTEVQIITASPVTKTEIDSVTAAPVTQTEVETTTASPVTMTEVDSVTAAPVTQTEIESVTGSPVTQTEVETITASPVTKTEVNSVTATEVLTTASPITQTETESSTVTTTSYSTATTLSTVTAPAKPSTTAASTCPADLSGNYQYPHLIIPISSATPTTAAGTSYNGIISSTTSSIFNFDVPASYAGHTCTLVFLLPEQSQLETSSYTTSGSGGIEVTQLVSPATSGTTYANAPEVESDLGTFNITPGSSTIIATGACAAGETLSYELSATGSYALTYFQDYNPSPIGLYITEC